MHFQRSVKRVSGKVNKGISTLAHQAFIAIGYAIPTCKSKEDVETLFQVLCGAKSLTCAIKIVLESSSLLNKYQPEHRTEAWVRCAHWCDWWTRPNHLSKKDNFYNTFSNILFYRDAVSLLLLYDIRIIPTTPKLY